MTEQLYLLDAYQKECEAKVVRKTTTGKKASIVLDRTILQPSHRDGGDRGHLVLEDDTSLYVPSVVMDRATGDIEHRSKTKLDILPDSAITCRLDWDHRYLLMRKHTGNHLLYGCAKHLAKRGFPALSKTSVGETYTCWIGEASAVDQGFIDAVFEMANALIAEEREVLIETLPRAAALEKCGGYHESVLPQSVDELRIVEIESLDSDPCIGLHVQNIKEIHGLDFLRIVREADNIKVFSEVA